jgi:hypothetical protein
MMHRDISKEMMACNISISGTCTTPIEYFLSLGGALNNRWRGLGGSHTLGKRPLKDIYNKLWGDLKEVD